MKDIDADRNDDAGGAQANFDTADPNADGSLLPARLEPKALERAQSPLTPAQARVDAVANVYHEAMSKASTLKFTAEETAALKADFPDDAFKLGAGGNPELLYIEHAYLRDRFDTVIGMGQWALVRTKPHWAEEYQTKKGERAIRLYAECSLLIRGVFVSEAIGEMSYFPNNASQSYADAAEGSETAAFRRCAKKIGVGLQAWKKDFCEGWKKRHGRYYQPPPSPAPPKAAPAAPAKPEPKATVATDKTRQWFISQIPEAGREVAKDYFCDLGWLLPCEKLEELGLRYVPTTKAQLAAVIAQVEDFAANGLSVQPYPPNEAAPINEPAKPQQEGKPKEPWRDYLVPFGKNAGTRLEDLDKKLLFGWFANYTVETEYQGRPRPADKIAKDREFRAMLDAAGVHYEFTKPEDKK